MDILEEQRAEVADIRDELDDFKEDARVTDKKVRTAQHALACAMTDLDELLRKIKLNGIDPKRCKHEIAEISGREGLGYSGHLCKKCRTLLVKETTYPDDSADKGRTIAEFLPEHPFKLDCRHPKGKVLTYKTAAARTGRPVVRGKAVVPLCTDGHYCTVCGLSWEGEPKA